MTGTGSTAVSPSLARLGTPQGRWVISAMVLVSTATFLSATVANIALPSIGAALGGSLAGMQWVVTAYLLALASLILPAGSAGDIFGRRRMILVGIAVFTLASLACALSPTLPILIAARLVQGAGAALVTPASLAIIDASFHPADRGKAIATWAAGSAMAAAAGPLLGGFLIDTLGWRWVFLLPLLLVAGSAAVTVRHVPETRDETLGRHLDLPSAALALVAVAGVAYSLVQGSAAGFGTPAVAAAGAGGGLALVGLGIAQVRRRDPMLPPRLFRSLQFSGANSFTILLYCAIGGAFFFTAIQFQTTLGYSALATGAALIPMNLLLFLVAPRVGALSARYGPRWPVTVGPVLAAAGLAILAMVDAGDRYPVDILPGVVLLGLGLASTVGPLTASVFAAAPEGDIGIASAVNNAVAQTGGLLGVAFLPYAAGMSTAGGVSGLAEGYRTAMLVAAGMALACAIIGSLTISRRADTHTDHHTSPTSGGVQRSAPAPASRLRPVTSTAPAPGTSA